MSASAVPAKPLLASAATGRLALAAGVALALVACSNKQATDGPQNYASKQPDGTVEMHQVQAAFIASGNGGTGALFFRGRSYPFSVGGAGIGGIGASTIDAEGSVYNLTDVSKFSGAYAQGRYGFAVGSNSGGDMWLKNADGVVLDLKAKRTGLMLSLGGDVVEISMDRE